MKLFVICGHGAGDSGACGNGYQEQERVRTLGRRIEELGGDAVLLGDINRNYYADNGISTLTISKEYQILELHIDSSSDPNPRGAHVIIRGGLEADVYDKALAKFLTGLFPGRSASIVGRTDLANPSRAAAKGYSYRLIECGFISNATDVSIFNGNIDTLAKGILDCFGINANNQTSTPSQNTQKYDVGTHVCVNRIHTSSTDSGAGHKGDWRGFITKVISGASHPYLIDNGVGWTDDIAIDTDPHNPDAIVDQVLYPGEHFIFAPSYEVEAVKGNLIYNSRLGGWLDAGPLQEVNGNNDQILYRGEQFNIPGKFTVQAAKTNAVLVKELGYWVFTESLTEV